MQLCRKMCKNKKERFTIRKILNMFLINICLHEHEPEI